MPRLTGLSMCRAGAGTASESMSNNSVAISTPAKPSASAWWIRATTATRRSASPSRMHKCQRGHSRSRRLT